MRLVFSLVSVLLAAACSAPVKEETAAAGGTAACQSSGATLCRAGTQFRCEAGAWHSTFRRC